ncbi:type II toxin-antitoxin system mRNA interferase toxin, RelE/StbE family [Candidatus Uhrbacteria bacterium]|nr:type II toxin-antitoxin system mRNA interferase toxin, RelE/StbE family [Candidatus Uhrbacteria bacterium]
MTVKFAPAFVRAYKKLPQNLQQEIKERIALFQSDHNHQFLKTHKLNGPLEGRLSFSVNYRYQIVFIFSSPEEATLLAVGDHGVYK